MKTDTSAASEQEIAAIKRRESSVDAEAALKDFLGCGDAMLGHDPPKPVMFKVAATKGIQALRRQRKVARQARKRGRR